jgi:hypothetical protein
LDPGFAGRFREEEENIAKFIIIQTIHRDIGGDSP